MNQNVLPVYQMLWYKPVQFHLQHSVVPDDNSPLDLGRAWELGEEEGIIAIILEVADYDEKERQRGEFLSLEELLLQAPPDLTLISWLKIKGQEYRTAVLHCSLRDREVSEMYREYTHSKRKEGDAVLVGTVFAKDVITRTETIEPRTAQPIS